jgi:hypothetical protein
VGKRAALVAVALGALTVTGGVPAAPVKGCPHFGKPALAADPHPHALRVFAIQFLQQPSAISSPAVYARAIDCAIRQEVVPHLAKGRPNVVVFDEDVGLETIAIGSRGTAARTQLKNGVRSCAGQPFPCATLAALSTLDTGYGSALSYLQARYPSLSGELGKSFVAATDMFVRAFMGTMAAAAERYGVYIVASNTQAPFKLTSDRAAVAALRDPDTPKVSSVYAPIGPLAYDQTFIWGPRVIDKRAPAPLANLIAVNRKVPLTSFESALGFAPGPATGAAATRNLRPVKIPGTGARLGFATSLPAFTYGSAAAGHACDDVSKTYVRCLDKLRANVLIQADANDGAWTGPDGSGKELWQPLSWMSSAYRAVTDPTVHFSYAVNPFMVGNLADTPFDGQTAIFERGRRGPGCHYIGNGSVVPGDDVPTFRKYAGDKPQFLALAPWVVSSRPRPVLRKVGNDLATGSGGYRYVQTAVIADLPFPLDRSRRGCVVAGR